jgi:hypothetical protein
MRNSGLPPRSEKSQFRFGLSASNLLKWGVVPTLETLSVRGLGTDLGGSDF